MTTKYEMESLLRPLISRRGHLHNVEMLVCGHLGRVGHTLVACPTRVGKTRLTELKLLRETLGNHGDH